MSRLPSPVTSSAVVLLTAAWCALWGEVTPANVLSGAGIAGLVVWGAGRGTARPIGRADLVGGQLGARRAIRPVALARLLMVVAVDLAKSTVTVVREVLTPTDHTHETIIAVDPGPGASDHLLLLVVAITITPGTAVVDSDPDTGRLFVHLLHADKADSVTRHVRRLCALAQRALPMPATPSSTMGEAVR